MDHQLPYFPFFFFPSGSLWQPTHACSSGLVVRCRNCIILVHVPLDHRDPRLNLTETRWLILQKLWNLSGMTELAVTLSDSPSGGDVLANMWEKEWNGHLLVRWVNFSRLWNQTLLPFLCKPRLVICYLSKFWLTVCKWTSTYCLSASSPFSCLSFLVVGLPWWLSDKESAC